MKKLLFCALLATMWTACSKDQTVTEYNSEAPASIYASIDEENEAASRVQLNEQKQTVWTANDELVVFHSQKIHQYQFAGKTGDRQGTFNYAGSYNTTGYEIPQVDGYYALYHSQKSPSWGFFSSGEAALFFNVPAEQNYLDSSYGVYSNAMVGTSSNGTNFSFRNLCGFLRLSIEGSGVVKSIELQGNNNEVLAGNYYFAVSNPLQLTAYDELSQKLTLNCGDGVALSSTATDFYFSMPPVDFTKGFTATIILADGTAYPQSTNKSISIRRNQIQPMAAFEINDGEWQTVTIHHTGETVAAPWLFTRRGTVATGFISWGDGAISMFNAVTNHLYSDDLPSHTVLVKGQEATGFVIQSLDGISEIDLSEL